MKNERGLPVFQRNAVKRVMSSELPALGLNVERIDRRLTFGVLPVPTEVNTLRAAIPQQGANSEAPVPSNGKLPPLLLTNPVAKLPPLLLTNRVAKEPKPDPSGTEKAATPTPETQIKDCLLYTSPSPRDLSTSRMPSSA